MEHSKPLKIVVADDDPDDRDFLRFLFRKNEHFELSGCFSSPAEVIDEIVNKSNIPDVLLLDMYMPLMTGAEVLSEILERNAAPKLFTFIISGTINVAEKEKFSSNPNVKFLLKPTTLEQINDLPGIILENLNHRNNTKV